MSGAPPPQNAPGRVLVVDDDEAIRSMLAELLREDGYAVDEAANGVEALERLRQAVPDAILLDLMMPVMDGWTFARRCRADPRSAAVPIIVLSAVQGLSQAAAELGIRTCLAKPFDLDVLLGIVELVVATATGRAASHHAV